MLPNTMHPECTQNSDWVSVAFWQNMGAQVLGWLEVERPQTSRDADLVGDTHYSISVI